MVSGLPISTINNHYVVYKGKPPTTSLYQAPLVRTAGLGPPTGPTDVAETEEDGILIVIPDGSHVM